MTADLMAFVRVRLDERAAIATAAGGDEWTLPAHESDTVLIYDAQREPVVYDEGSPSEAQARHVVAHSPARVLREIAAKRVMIDEYAGTVRLRDEASDRIKAAGDAPDAKDLDTWSRAHREASILESWMELLAAPYCDHPDYPLAEAPDA